MDTSRRAVLGAVACTGASGLAGCLDESGDPELLAQVDFELTDDDLLPGWETYGSGREDASNHLIRSRSDYEELVNPSAWPDDVDGDQFDRTDFSGREFVVATEISLTEEGSAEIGDVQVSGDRLLYDVSVTCNEGALTRLRYRFQQWRQPSGLGIVEALANFGCLSSESGQ